MFGVRQRRAKRVVVVDPFRTAVSFWKQTTLISSSSVAITGLQYY